MGGTRVGARPDLAAWSIPATIDARRKEGTEMFVSLKEQVHDEEVRSLLACRIWDDEQLDETIAAYENEDFWELYGIAVDGEIVGLIGYEYVGEGTLVIRDLVVKPDWRGLGYGRGLILETIALENPTELVVETDDEVAVDFFRHIGFTIFSRGMNELGTETFRCIYECNEEASV